MEVDRTLMLKYGVQLPTQFPLIYLGSLLAGVPPVIPSAVTGTGELLAAEKPYSARASATRRYSPLWRDPERKPC